MSTRRSLRAAMSNAAMSATISESMRAKHSIPDTPYKRPPCSHTLHKQKRSEKWPAPRSSLKDKWAAVNDAWLKEKMEENDAWELREAIMREDQSTFTLLEKALNDK